MSTVDLVTDTDAAIIDMSNIQQTRWNLFTLLQDTKHVQRWQKVVDEIELISSQKTETRCPAGPDTDTMQQPEALCLIYADQSQPAIFLCAISCCSRGWTLTGQTAEHTCRGERVCELTV